MEFLRPTFICLVLAYAVFACWSCPEPNVTQIVDYSEIKGDWVMAASFPDLLVKCRNIVISESDGAYELKDEYSDWRIFSWEHTEKVYCMQDNHNSSKIELQKKSFPYSRSSYTLLHGVFSNYMILYKCSSYFFFIKESFEIWARNGTDYDCHNLTDVMTATLDLYKMKPENMTLTCMVQEDCDLNNLT